MLQLHSVYIIFAVLLLISLFEINALPLIKNNIDPEISSGQFEGDMLLTPEQLNDLTNSFPKIQGRNGLVSPTYRWPNNIVYYKIVGNFDAAHRQAILEGIATIEARTCIRFHEADDSQPHYVAITSDSGGCYTAVGYLAKVQQMNLEVYPLNEGCFRTGTILHEFMHALGFYHQQSDPQRDDYIEILYENVIPGKEFNFEKYQSTFVTDFDMGYDYESCLHYSSTAFSVNGKATIRTLDSKAEIGQRIGLSDKDISKINIMYKCPILI
ncbi:seminal metalloprotease 1 [Lucilia cuprina]|uniref:seminal metalloprotease 1 n=1 Tax=Lucilia cuprina TaxID=7375 RepID=UPI001F054C0B|nr:seminal metalloprotease 1 [Lucilia cuprina]